MLKQFVVVLAVLMVAACSSSDKEGVAGANGQGGSSQYGVDGRDVNVVPGTQEDLVVNVGDRVFFDFDSAVLSGEGQNVLTRQAEWLKQYAEVTVTIEGHCDERGTREYNLALGERRATAVRNYLVGSGVSAGRISIISYGKERPEVVGSSESAWEKNRRGVTVVN